MKKYFIIIFILALSLNAYSTDYWVNNSDTKEVWVEEQNEFVTVNAGDNLYEGTSETNPFFDLPTAFTAMSTGDTVFVVGDGEVDVDTYSTFNNGVGLSIGVHIYGVYKYRKPVFTIKDEAGLTGSFVSSAKRIRFYNCVANSAYALMQMFGDDDNNLFDDIEFDSCFGQWQLWFYAGTYQNLLFKGNYITGTEGFVRMYGSATKAVNLYHCSFLYNNYTHTETFINNSNAARTANIKSNIFAHNILNPSYFLIREQNTRDYNLGYNNTNSTGLGSNPLTSDPQAIVTGGETTAFLNINSPCTNTGHDGNHRGFTKEALDYEIKYNDYSNAQYIEILEDGVFNNDSRAIAISYSQNLISYDTQIDILSIYGDTDTSNSILDNVNYVDSATIAGMGIQNQTSIISSPLNNSISFVTSINLSLYATRFTNRYVFEVASDDAFTTIIAADTKTVTDSAYIATDEDSKYFRGKSLFTNE